METLTDSTTAFGEQARPARTVLDGAGNTVVTFQHGNAAGLWVMQGSGLDGSGRLAWLSNHEARQLARFILGEGGPS